MTHQKIMLLYSHEIALWIVANNMHSYRKSGPYSSVPGTFGEQTDDVPPVDSCDLLSYLVLRTSFITTEQFRAWKGLEAYNQFVCGWVKEVVVRKVDTKFVTTGRVRKVLL